MALGFKSPIESGLNANIPRDLSLVESRNIYELLHGKNG
jgi:hypothetical protein